MQFLLPPAVAWTGEKPRDYKALRPAASRAAARPEQGAVSMIEKSTFARRVRGGKRHDIRDDAIPGLSLRVFTLRRAQLRPRPTILMSLAIRYVRFRQPINCPLLLLLPLW